MTTTAPESALDQAGRGLLGARGHRRPVVGRGHAGLRPAAARAGSPRPGSWPARCCPTASRPVSGGGSRRCSPSTPSPPPSSATWSSAPTRPSERTAAVRRARRPLGSVDGAGRCRHQRPRRRSARAGGHVPRDRGRPRRVRRLPGGRESWPRGPRLRPAGPGRRRGRAGLRPRGESLLRGLDLEPPAVLGARVLQAQVLRRAGPAASEALAELDAGAGRRRRRARPAVPAPAGARAPGRHPAGAGAAGRKPWRPPRRRSTSPAEDVRSQVMALRALGSCLRATGDDRRRHPGAHRGPRGRPVHRSALGDRGDGAACCRADSRSAGLRLGCCRRAQQPARRCP